MKIGSTIRNQERSEQVLLYNFNVYAEFSAAHCNYLK